MNFKNVKAPISRFTVHGNSMKPTLNPGQDVLSINWFVNPKVGDIVVIKKGSKEIVKRVQNVHDREVFVQGDNADESTDSRDFGAVSMDQVVGKVMYLKSIKPVSSNRSFINPKF